MRGIRIYITCGTVDRASGLMVQRERKQHFEPASRAARGFNLTSMHLDGSQCKTQCPTQVLQWTSKAFGFIT